MHLSQSHSFGDLIDCGLWLRRLFLGSMCVQASVRCGCGSWEHMRAEHVRVEYALGVWTVRSQLHQLKCVPASEILSKKEGPVWWVLNPRECYRGHVHVHTRD